ncbi:hypothetical protein JB92DRAFT_3095977 [Gautieria morchelliformis]|nr:hypothetical protein JB92DRAFT_3095977 [Gautieria morchelliformis]
MLQHCKWRLTSGPPGRVTVPGHVAGRIDEQTNNTCTVLMVFCIFECHCLARRTMIISESVAVQDQLIVLVHDNKVIEYATAFSLPTVASTALLYYDSVLTFFEEVDLVWRQRLSWGKFLYLVIRYLSLLAQTFNTAAVSLSKIMPGFWTQLLQAVFFASIFKIASTNVIMWLVEFNLATRVWLLYDRSPTLLLTLGFVYMSSLTAVTVMNIVGLSHGQIVPRPFPFLTGCNASIPTWFYGVNFPPLVTSVLLVVLTLYRTLQTLRCAGSTRGVPLFAVFLRDGLLNFSAVAVMLTFNTLFFHLARMSLVPVGVGFVVVVPCISGSRLFLNVRQKLLHPSLITSLPLQTLDTRPAGFPTVEDTDTDGTPLSSMSSK